MGLLLRIVGGLLGVGLGMVIGLVALIVVSGGNLADAGRGPLLVAEIIWVLAMVLGGLLGWKSGALADEFRNAPVKTKRPFQFSLRTGFVVVTLIAIVFGVWPIIDRKTETVSHRGWQYTMTFSRFRPDSPIYATTLTYHGVPVPEELVKNRVSLDTPLGTFKVDGAGHWHRVGYQTPLPQGQWVSMTIGPAPGIMAEFLEQRYYDTSQLTDYAVSNGPWVDVQFEGTPEEWVYAYKITPTGHIGYWVDPRRLGELAWPK